MPSADNFIVLLNIGSYFLKRVIIKPTADVSLLYSKTFQAIFFHSSMLTQPTSALKSFMGDLSSLLGTIRLHIKTRIEDDKYINSKETFYLVNTTSRDNAIISWPGQHTIGVVLSTLIKW